jgi:ABC-type multidrug transport system fused ATPase/permease subunit
MIATLWYFTLVEEQKLTASIVFSALTAFNLLRGTLFEIIYFIPQMIQAKVSLKRIEEYLNDVSHSLSGSAFRNSFRLIQSDLIDRCVSGSQNTPLSSEHANDFGVGQASFSWGNKLSVNDPDTAQQPVFRLRVDEPITFKRGALNLISGPTGSGKTSLLMALLGEMRYVPTRPEAWVNLPRGGGVAYCAQESWVQSLSIRDNILFGLPYNEVRYSKGG